MARARKGRGRKPARSKTRFDWVYRPDQLGEGAPGIGSYNGGNAKSVQSGVLGATIFVLYDSVDVLMEVDRLSHLLPRAARAEGRNAMVGGVELDIAYIPSTWAEDGLLIFGWRLGWYEQDSTTTLPAVLDDYTMWATTIDAQQPAIDANDRQQNIRDWRTWNAFNESVTSPIFHFHRFVSLKRRAPSSRHCLGLYVEGAAQSSDIRAFLNCRTLVADEG